MSNIPKQLRYTSSHEWVMEDDDVLIVGITDHAQTMLGDLVYVELPEVESNIDHGEECAVVESVKAAADIYCPISGEVTEINTTILDHPQLINQDPYGHGWLFKIRPFETNFSTLLNADEYAKVVTSEAH